MINLTNFSVQGKALCGSKKCRAELGRIQIFKDHPNLKSIYPLKCASIKIRQTENDTAKEQILMKKKWTAMPFAVPTLEMLLSTTNDEEVFYDIDDNPSSDFSF